MAIAEPHKELRFTRAAQAVPFWIAAAISGATAIVLISISFSRGSNPDLPHPAWGLLPVALCWAFLRLALHCTRRAYIILSPLGVEIFPLIKPISGMRMIPWGEIDAVEVGQYVVTLHFDSDQSNGVHLELAPITKKQRPLLAKALKGRVEDNTDS